MDIQSPIIVTNLTLSGSVSLTPESQASLVGQLTGSLDQNYIVSGSLTQTTWENLSGKPEGIVSGSSQLNNSTLSGMTISGSFSGSYAGDGSGLTGLSINTTAIEDNAVTSNKIADGAVTLAKIQDIPTATVLGRVTAGTGEVEELSSAELASLVSAGSFLVFKIFNQEIASSTTLVDDDYLVFNLPANSVFYIRGYIYVGVGGGGYKYEINVPSDSVYVIYLNDTDIVSTNTGSGLINSPILYFPTILTKTVDGIVEIKGIINSNTQGDFKLKFAQNTSNATPAITKAGSFLEFVPINYNFPQGLILVDCLIIAGGGGGGSAGAFDRGGGGAGGYRTLKTILFSNNEYTVTVGAGGAPGAAGSYSSIAGNYIFENPSGAGAETYKAYGGGNGGAGSTVGGSGGSGGGGGGGGSFAGGNGNTPATFPSQGNKGGNGASGGGGGGGGAGQVGLNAVVNTAGKGGDGLSSDITGTLITRAGGGGGAGSTPASGGAGGGGAGKLDTGDPGVANTGGGGGGGRSPYIGGAGGSGVVIIRTLDGVPEASTTGSPTITTSGGYRIYVFNASGTITWN